jgi:hypothetical protein
VQLARHFDRLRAFARDAADAITQAGQRVFQVARDQDLRLDQENRDRIGLGTVGDREQLLGSR